MCRFAFLGGKPDILRPEFTKEICQGVALSNDSLYKKVSCKLGYFKGMHMLETFV